MQDVIYVACDDSGAEAKGWILEYLDAHGYAWRDCGGDETPSRYPYYAAKVAAGGSPGGRFAAASSSAAPASA